MVWNGGAVTTCTGHIGRTVDERIARQVANLACGLGLLRRILHLQLGLKLPGMNESLVTVDAL